MLGALFLGILATTAFTEPVAHKGLILSEAHIRAMPPQAPVAGGYLTIRNDGPEADRLIAARSSQAGEVQIHEMTMNGDVMKMHELPDGLPIPVGAPVDLKPGGYHRMFMHVTAPFAEGQIIEASQVFEKAGEVALPFEVRAMRPAPTSGQGHDTGHSGC
ncbi:copper chaperone PCu(A)C [Paracoccus litorisediminis]